jgi:integrase
LGCCDGEIGSLTETRTELTQAAKLSSSRGPPHSEELNPKPRAFVRLLILTAAREMEVADIATGEVALEAGRWTIPQGRTKNGTPHTVPLCPLALAELSAVWPGDGKGPALRRRLLGATGGGLRGFSKLKARLDALSGVRGWRWHDLRRTARTGMTRLGVARDHAEAAINHVSGRSALERTYDRHDYAAEVVTALSTWQAHVAELVAPAASCSAKFCGQRGEARGVNKTAALSMHYGAWAFEEAER